MEPRTVLFLHIPRAGGTTFTDVLLRQYPRQSVYLIRSTHIPETLSAFARLTDEEKKRIRLIRGHMTFGLHESIPGPSTYITFLRHPVERVISEYYLRIERGVVPRFGDAAAQRDHLIGFFETSAYRFNRQTRLLAGDRTVVQKDVENPPQSAPGVSGWLKDAIAHLESHFAAFGLTEQFDASLLLMQELLGWGSATYRKRNVSTGRVRLADLPPETIRRIQDENALDMALFEYALAHFEAQFKRADGLSGAGLARRVEHFKQRNTRYGALAAAISAPLDAMRSLKRNLFRR